MKLSLALLMILASSQIVLAAGKATPVDETETSSYSQPKTYSESIVSRLIPQAGAIVSGFSGSDNSWNTKTGFSIGALLDFGRSNFVFETGLLYRQLGAGINLDLISATLDLDYLSAPLVGKYYFSGQEMSSLYLKAGLLPSLLVSKNLTVSALGLSASTGDFSGINTFDLQGIVALGGKIVLNPGLDLIIESSYSRGFTTVSSDGASVYNWAAALTAGLGVKF